MSLKIYNTLTRKKELFKPTMGDTARMYVCGPTVYNYISIGNARPVIVFDMVRNYLEYKGYQVIYVQNITDIEDKIIDKAKEENVNFTVITKRYIDAFLMDIRNLKVGRFSKMPLASEMIEEIIGVIQKIIENGYGYVADGNVFFDVHKLKNYGKLSGQKVEEMKAQEDDNLNKKNNIDFTLWKSAKPGEPCWDSPWGKGRPGWHIECTIMATKFLGFGIDIHGGGIDLIFPHHENEIAQSEAAFPDKGGFVRYWMHNGMIIVKEEKMSKSLGLEENWILKNLLKIYSSNVIKLYMLSTHYRSPLEFNLEKLEEAKRALERFVNTFINMKFLIENYNKTLEEKNNIKNSGEKLVLRIDGLLKKCTNDFAESMDDDFNSAKALGCLFELVKNLNSIIQNPNFIISNPVRKSLGNAYKQIKKLGLVLGIDFEEEVQKTKQKSEEKTAVDNKKIEELIRLRENARENKDYKQADEIRKKLHENGIILEDRKEGTIWKLRDKKDEYDKRTFNR